MQSTASMKREVSKEVSNQLGGSIDKLAEKFAREIAKQLKNTRNGEINITNQFDVTNNTPFEVKDFGDSIEEKIRKQLNKQGIKSL